MRIGELARKAGTTPSAVRYYEDAGLLPAPQRTESGYRDYDEKNLQRIQLLIQSRALGFSIQEVRVIVAAMDDDDPCPEVAEIVQRRITAIDRETEGLQSTRRDLSARLAAWKAGSLSNQECLCAILQTQHNTNEESTMNKPTIEVFTAGCRLCDEAVRVVKEAVATCGCNVVVLPADGDEAKKRNINVAPAVWKDGESVFCGTPTLDEAIAKLRVGA